MKVIIILLLPIVALLLLGCRQPETKSIYRYAHGSDLLNNQEQMTIVLRSDGSAIFKGESSTNQACFKENHGEISFEFPAYQQVGLNGTTLLFVKQNNDLFLKRSPEIRFRKDTD